jgi:ABC-type transport system involved in cytochrome c biogenesis ATPase subunit
MKLLSLAPTKIGPFASGGTLTFEPDVTVITGRNDVGKSALLKLVAMVCARRVEDVLSESDVNFDHLVQAKRAWNDDGELKCEAEFNWQIGQPTARYEAYLAPQQWPKSSLHWPNEGTSKGPSASTRLPKVLQFSAENEAVRQQLSLTELNSTERRFIGVAFGPSFRFDALNQLSELAYENAVARAEDSLNTRLASLLPPTLPFRFRIRSSSEKRDRLFVNLRDEHGCSTALGQRGAGVQKMVNFLGRLAIENIGTNPTILLLDEPENSLHADAQHTLRRALEELATSNHHIQIIYTTHSPCMVNPMRPQSLRLLRRVPRGESAVSEMDNQPFSGNFAAVRTSLGLGPADSLLYAPLCVIVEGKTEALCLPILLQRLHADGLAAFAGVPEMLSQSLFLEATGSGSISELCRLAKAQGSKVVVFADGDVSRRWRDQMQKQHSDVPLVTLADRHEFEQLVPPKDYLHSIANALDVADEAVGLEVFEAWCEQAKLPEWMGWSKRVERWLADSLGKRMPEKARTMRAACEAVAVEAIQSQALAELVRRLRGVLT